MSKTAATDPVEVRLSAYLTNEHGVPKAAADKVAAGITIYLLEELGDARLRCAQLKKYVKEATDLIEKSPQRDHFFEVAAHLIHGIPDTLFKMEKALDASAMAAARLDYEEVKDNIRPEKADELEDALQDVRLRYLKRRSGDEEVAEANDGGQETPERKGTSMTPKDAADQLLAIASQTDAHGQVPLGKVITLLASIEGRNKRASTSGPKASAAFRKAAADLVSSTPPTPAAFASWLRNVIADQMAPTSAAVAAAIYQTAGSREQVMKGFKDANPSMTDEQLEKAADMWEKHKDVVKNKQNA
jgi:hypothetical protein